MVITIARAIAWGVSGLLGVRHDELVARHDLEHAHWDPGTRTWFTHVRRQDESSKSVRTAQQGLGDQPVKVRPGEAARAHR
jgi:hypothetical protein